MKSIAKVLIGLSALAFVLAVISPFVGGRIWFVPAESFSRACNNLALIAIGLTVCFKEKVTAS